MKTVRIFLAVVVVASLYAGIYAAAIQPRETRVEGRMAVGRSRFDCGYLIRVPEFSGGKFGETLCMPALWLDQKVIRSTYWAGEKWCVPARHN